MKRVPPSPEELARRGLQPDGSPFPAPPAPKAVRKPRTPKATS